MKLSDYIANKNSNISAPLVSGVSIISLLLSEAKARQSAIESALKLSLICNEKVAIPSQSLEGAFNSKLLEWVPSRWIGKKHGKLKESFLFIDDEEWSWDRSSVEYHPGINLSLVDYDKILNQMDLRGAENLLGYNRSNEGHELHDSRSNLDIRRDIDDIIGEPHMASTFIDGELQKYIFSLMAGVKVDINKYDLFCLARSNDSSISENKYIDPNLLFREADKKLDILLPDVSELDWSNIVDIRENPKTEEFRKFLRNTDFLLKEKAAILEDVNQALVDALGLHISKRKSNVVTKVFENLPIPISIPLPNPLALWNWYRTSRKEKELYKKYPWFWTYYNCKS